MKLNTLLKNETYSLIQGSLEKEIKDLCFDSRHYQKGELFIALKGTHDDGHHHITEVLELGCQVLMVEEVGIYPSNITVIQVEDTTKTLARISANFFDHPERKLELIGITGTSGKTTTSFILKALLETTYQVGLIGTNGAYYQNQKIELENTTPNSYHLYRLLDQMTKENIDIVILEVSSQALKYHRVEGLHFKHALITNISQDHIRIHEHPNMEDYIYSKKQLFRQCDHAYLNKDDSFYSWMKETSCFNHTYGFNEADLFIDKTLYYFDKTYFKVKGIIEEDFMVTLPGIPNLYNTLGALLIAYQYDIALSKIKEVLSKIHVEGRFETYRYKNRTFVIDYAHNLDSYQKLMETIHAFPFRRCIIVIGAGGNRSASRRKEVMKILKPYVDLFILTEDNSRDESVEKIVDELKQDLEPNTFIIEYHRDQAIRKAFEISKEKDIIVIAGKGHENYVIKNHQRIPFNDASFLKSLLK